MFRIDSKFVVLHAVLLGFIHNKMHRFCDYRMVCLWDQGLGRVKIIKFNEKFWYVSSSVTGNLRQFLFYITSTEPSFAPISCKFAFKGPMNYKNCQILEHVYYHHHLVPLTQGSASLSHIQAASGTYCKKYHRNHSCRNINTSLR
jgi:hypothetical protein